MWFQVCDKIAMLVSKITLRKVQKTTTIKNIKCKMQKSRCFLGGRGQAIRKRWNSGTTFRGPKGFVRPTSYINDSRIGTYVLLLGIRYYVLLTRVKLDGVGPVDNRLTTDQRHHFVQQENFTFFSKIAVTLEQLTQF